MPLSAAIGSALIGGGSNLLGGALNFLGQSNTNKLQNQLMDKQNAFNEKMFNKQNEYNDMSWQRTVDYNDPTAAKKRMTDAGYNPFFSTGQVAAGSAATSTPQSAQASPSAGAELRSPLQGLGSSLSNAGNDFVNNYNNVLMATSSSAAKDSEAVKNLADASKTNVEKSQLSQFGTKLLQQKLNIGNEQTKLIRFQAEGSDLANMITSTYGLQTAAANVQLMTNNSLKALSERNLADNNINLVKARVKNTIQDTYKKLAETSSIKLNYQQQKDLYNDTIEMYRVQLQRQKAQLQIDRINSQQSQLNLDLDKQYKDSERKYGVQNLDYRNKNLDINYKRSKDKRIYDGVTFGLDTALKGVELTQKTIDLLNPVKQVARSVGFN